MERLKQLLQAEEIRFAENEPLSAAAFKIGGPADVFARRGETALRVIALCQNPICGK